MPACVFDCHADTPLELWKKQETMLSNTCHIDFIRARWLTNYAQFFAFCTYSTGLTLSGRYFTAQELYQLPKAYMDKLLQSEAAQISLCTNATQLKQAWEQGKIAAFYSLEGAEGIGCDMTQLQTLYKDGVRMLSLTWNGDNLLAGAHGSHVGLSVRGVKMVKRAQELGMIIDVSHSSEQAARAIAQISTLPIVASHSNSKHLCPNSRNVSDELYLAICTTGGLVGINLYAPFLDEKEANFDTIYAHIDHFLELSGDNHVALGGDLDGCDALPNGFKGIDSYHVLREFLLTKYSQTTVDKIYFQNILRVVEACCK